MGRCTRARSCKGTSTSGPSPPPQATASASTSVSVRSGARNTTRKVSPTCFSGSLPPAKRSNKTTCSASDPAAETARLRSEYEERFANPYIAASRGYVDDVIMPSETRPRLISALEMLDGKRQANLPRKHGNIPL